MRIITFLLISMTCSAFADTHELGCQDPSGVYESPKGAILYISQDLEVEVIAKDKNQIFIGEIIDFEEYKISKYNNFSNSPEILSKNDDLASWALMHIDGNCQSIKMGWFIGEKLGKRKMVGKYFFERNT
ncbi:hypothetical protein R50072_36550 [Simiduia litorea]|uniref:hypothetical protein n=1 Tax=Simiduia litorea TaxID=1435348 RepID=UPI0036F1D7F8